MEALKQKLPEAFVHAVHAALIRPGDIERLFFFYAVRGTVG